MDYEAVLRAVETTLNTSFPADEAREDHETFVVLHGESEFDAFYTANEAALTDIGSKAVCYALACNCDLLLGGGAAPLIRVGFVD